MQRRTTAGSFDPYHKWLGLPPGKWMPDHFELLGLSIDEEDPTVIEHAIKRQRDFMKGMRGGKFPELVNQILIQIQDAEITLLEPDSRRKYVREIKGGKGYKKSAKSRRSGSSRRGGTVGESSGITREFAGVMGIIGGGFIVVAVVSFMLPWGELTGGGSDAAGLTADLAGADSLEDRATPIKNQTLIPSDQAIGTLPSTVIASDELTTVEASSPIASAAVTGDATTAAKQIVQTIAAAPSTPEPSAIPIKVELIELRELNGSETYVAEPWLSPDGMSIYWQSQKQIWSAQRENATSLFTKKKSHLAGRHPTVSADGLEMIFLTGRRDGQKGESLWVTTRTSSNSSFKRPKEIQEFARIPALKPKNPSLSLDRLTVIFNGVVGGLSIPVYSTRDSVTSPWQQPQALPIDTTGIDGVLTWCSVTNDGLTLFCANEATTRPNGNLLVFTRSTATQAFSNPKVIEKAGIPALSGRAPRYCPATNELVFAEKGNPNEFKLWIVKGFTP